MADIKVRQLDDRVVDALKMHARGLGISLEEEVRRILTDTVVRRRRSLEARMGAVRARVAAATPGDPSLDSARTIREERDAWG